MAVDIHKLIAAVVPEVYCEPYVIDSGTYVDLVAEVKKSAKEQGMRAAAEKAKPREAVFMDLIDIKQTNAADAPGLKAPNERHVLVYDSFGEGLEPVYFWILDKMNERFKNVDKLVDNFVSAPGSGHFSEMGIKATKMQEEAMKILGVANQIVKSVLNIIYDLKEFKLRLQLYDDYQSEEKAKSNSAFLSLKQIWLDTVDIKKGTTAMKAMLQNFDYATLLDAFMATRTLEDVTKPAEEGGLDLNERVRRILQQRFGEFLRWLKESEQELRKRFEIEKIYLRSQVSTLKLYSRWAKPYLRSAKELEQRMQPSAALVTAFNTSMFELVILGHGEYDPTNDIMTGELPKLFLKLKAKKFSPIMIVEFRYRTAPERMQQGGYAYRGRAEVVFSSYALTPDELKTVREELDKDDVNELISLIEGATTESLEQIHVDLEEFLEEKKEKAEETEEKEKKEEGDVNPFGALFSLFTKKEEKKEDGGKESELLKDNRYEKILRSQAIISARKTCYNIYDLYKKAHQMACLPNYD